MLLSLYLHIPFCKRKCFYCDFCSASVSREDMEAYCDALMQEMALSATTVMDAQIDTVFFGGGTPSLLPVALMDRLLSRLGRLFPMGKEVEFTMEANPGTLTADWLAMVKHHGVNRLSLGVQASQDRLLGRLGRIHTYAQAVEAVALARRHGVHNLNIDVMYGLPGQSLDDYRDTLRRVAALQPTHISAYSLILEVGTRLAAQVEAGECVLPNEDEVAAMLEQGRDWLEAHGYGQYEISSFAKPGYQCRHNLGYWRGRWYLGLGVSAASMLPVEMGQRASPESLYIRRENVMDQSAYLRLIAEGKLPAAEEHGIDKQEAMFETLMLGLRTVAGVNEAAFATRFGLPLCKAYGEAMEELIGAGLACFSGVDDQRAFTLTQTGLMMQNQVLLKFMQ